MFASRVQALVHCSFKGRKRETSMCSSKLQSETQMTGITSTVYLLQRAQRIRGNFILLERSNYFERWNEECSCYQQDTYLGI